MMIAPPEALRADLATEVGSFYDWIREDWLSLSSQPGGSHAGLLNFGLWSADAHNLHDAQLALHYRVLRPLEPLPTDAAGLEIGCGVGGTAVKLAAESRRHLTCLDLVETQLALARERARAHGVADLIAFRQGNAMDMPFPAAQFDFSYCLESSFHYPDIPAFLRENWRVLKPGATGIIADITCERPEAIVFRRGNFFYGFAAMQQMLADAGFEAIQSERIGAQVFAPLYAYMLAQAPGEDSRLRRYWRLVLKNYAELAAEQAMGYDIFVFRKPAAA